MYCLSKRIKRSVWVLIISRPWITLMAILDHLKRPFTVRKWNSTIPSRANTLDCRCLVSYNCFSNTINVSRLGNGSVGKLRTRVCFWWGGEVLCSLSGVGVLFQVLWLSLCSCDEMYCHDAHLRCRDPAGHHKPEKWFSWLLAGDRRTFISLFQHSYCVCEHACVFVFCQMALC